MRRIGRGRRRYGRTSNHIQSVDIVTADGFLLTATSSGLEATVGNDGPARNRAKELEAQLRALSAENLGIFRLELGRIPRQVSGFHVTRLLPENGFDVARSLVGSEGMCAIVVAARVKPVPVPKAAMLVSLGYNDVADAARDVMTILDFDPVAIEGIDEAIVETMLHLRGTDSVQRLPNGKAWLYVDLDGDDPEELARQAHLLLSRVGEFRAEIRVPGVQTRVEVNDRNRTVLRVHGTKERQGDRVISTDGHHFTGSLQQGPGARLDPP